MSVACPILMQATDQAPPGNSKRCWRSPTTIRSELMKPAWQYDKATTISLYVRGLAYLKAGDGASAAGEFQKVLALSNYAPTDLLITFARLGMARAYALQGDTAKAKSAYQDILAFWKDADPDLPTVMQVKAEYAKLQ